MTILGIQEAIATDTKYGVMQLKIPFLLLLAIRKTVSLPV